MSAKRITNLVVLSVFIFTAFVFTTVVQASPSPKTAVKYFNTPLLFEPNEGQSGPGIDFVAHGKGYVLHLSSNEAVFALRREQLSMRLVGSNHAAQASLLEPLEPKLNYFIGNDPSRWRTDIPTYGKARYQNVYAGIDVVYYGNGDQLEYDFIVAPGADPGRIALDFAGARRIRADRRGDLLIDGEYGTLRFDRPVIYQEVNGRRQKVAGKFVVAADRVHFEVGKFDHTRTLIIDPSLVFSIYLGGTSFDIVTATAADNDASSNGPHAYVTGYTNSTDFPTLNAYQRTLTGSTDAYVSKLDSTGKLLYSTFLGGSSNTQGYGIAIDASHNIYITGRTDSDNFPVAGNAVFQATRRSSTAQPGHANAFITEFSAAGSLMNSTYVGGSGDTPGGSGNTACRTGDQGNGITVNASSGMVYITGFTDSTDFPHLSGSPLCSSAFVFGVNFATNSTVKFPLIGDQTVDPSGNASPNSGQGLALDGAGNIYVTGYIADRAMNDPGNVFAYKFDPAANISYQLVIGGSNFDSGNAIVVDTTGNAYIAGATASADFSSITNGTTYNGPIRAGGGPHPGSSGDALLLKLDPIGGVSYAGYLGGTSHDQATGVALDSQGNVSVAGSTNSSDFPTKNTFYPYGGPNGPGTVNYDAFVAHFDPTLTLEYYSTFIGGSSDDFGLGLATAQLPNSTTNYSFVGGYTSSSDFPKTAGRSASNPTGFVTLISEITISKLGIIGTPANTPVAATIQNIQVAIQDANGATVTDATSAVTIALGANPGNATLSGTTTVNAVGGIATFSGLSIDKIGVGYTIIATSTSPALTSAPSAKFNIFQPVLVFSAQPVDTAAGAAIPAVKVAVQDGSGNTFAGATNAVTLAIGSNSAGGTLGGTTTVNAVAGVATFTGLTIDKIGNGYTLVASANGATSGTSAVFNITQPRPSQTKFANFSCDKIEGWGGNDDHENHFHLDCDFTLGAGNNGISPATTDAFALNVGSATISLPAGSFHNDGKEKPASFSFQSKENKGMELEIHITPKADLKKGPTYHLEVEAEGSNFGTVQKGSQTVTLTLTIGNNTGTTAITVNGKRDD
jgi:hypothetical protein